MGTHQHLLNTGMQKNLLPKWDDIPEKWCHYYTPWFFVKHLLTLTICCWIYNTACWFDEVRTTDEVAFWCFKYLRSLVGTFCCDTVDLTKCQSHIYIYRRIQTGIHLCLIPLSKLLCLKHAKGLLNFPIPIYSAQFATTDLCKNKANSLCLHQAL